MENLKVGHLSDLHIKPHKDLLEPVIGTLNEDDLDLVVVTGDLVNDSEDRESFKKASLNISKIKHKTVVVPGEYDAGDLWKEYFGERYTSRNFNNALLIFLDTSFMGHKFAHGWQEYLKEKDPEQYEWFLSNLDTDKYTFVFSHHPLLLRPKQKKGDFLRDNVRAYFSGHLHKTFTAYFNYDEPTEMFSKGLISVPIRFHGNSLYVRNEIKPTGELTQTPKILTMKRNG